METQTTMTELYEQIMQTSDPDVGHIDTQTDLFDDDADQLALAEMAMQVRFANFRSLFQFLKCLVKISAQIFYNAI